jgi:hypothetical protein
MEPRLLHAIEQMEASTAKIEKIYMLLAGDEKLHQEGLIQRIMKLEAAVDRMDTELTKAKGWIGGALFVGSIVGSVITFIIKTLFK